MRERERERTGRVAVALRASAWPCAAGAATVLAGACLGPAAGLMAATAFVTGGAIIGAAALGRSRRGHACGDGCGCHASREAAADTSR